MRSMRRAACSTGRSSRSSTIRPPTRSSTAPWPSGCLTEDRVKLIFGCYMSSTRKTAMPVVEAFRGLLFYPTLYEGFEYSPNCIYTGASPNQNSLQLARYLFEVYGNRFLMVGSNYVFPLRVQPHHRRSRGADPRQGARRDLRAARGAAGDFARRSGRSEAEAGRHLLDRRRRRRPPRSTRPTTRPASTRRRQPIASLTTSEAEVAEMPRRGGRRAHHRRAVLRDARHAGGNALRRRLQGAFRRGCAGAGCGRGGLFPGASGGRGHRARRHATIRIA